MLADSTLLLQRLSLKAFRAQNTLNLTICLHYVWFEDMATWAYPRLPAEELKEREEQSLV